MIIDAGAPGPRCTGLGNVGGFTRDTEVGARPGDYVMVGKELLLRLHRQAGR